MLTGAAKINDFRSKLAFRSRFARSGAHFYAQARWFRTLCTGAVVLHNCAKPSRLCTKIARLQNRQKPMRKRQVSTGIGALLARFGRYFSVVCAAGRRRPKTSTPALLRHNVGHMCGHLPHGSRILPDGSRTPGGSISHHFFNVACRRLQTCICIPWPVKKRIFHKSPVFAFYSINQCFFVTA